MLEAPESCVGISGNGFIFLACMNILSVHKYSSDNEKQQRTNELN